MNPPTSPAPAKVRFRMMLFVAGDEPNSRRARENIERVCGDRLDGECDLKVVDVFDHFQTALDYDIVITPTLVILEPTPRVTLLGNLSDTVKLRTALGLI
jgi:circadian clock protein KaiB